MYRVEAITASGRETADYETAEHAMTAVNRLSVRHARSIVIRDGQGVLLNERQLAMIVMEARYIAARTEAEQA